MSPVASGKRWKRIIALLLFFIFLPGFYIWLLIPAFAAEADGTLFRSAQRAKRSGDVRLAERLLLSLLRQDPNSEKSFALLGECYEERHEWKLALDCFRRALILHPGVQTYQEKIWKLEPLAGLKP